MKNKIIYITIAILLIVVVYACRDDKSVTGVVVSPNQLTLAVGEEALLTATIQPDDAINKIVTWESNNTDVATMNNNKVTAIAEGTATITVFTDEGNYKATCELTVIHPAEPILKFVKGGTFTMGCSEEQASQCLPDELPKHQVSVDGVNIGKYEVTQKQWKMVMGDNPSHFIGDNLPVENVNQNDVLEFISKLNELTGKQYRLPTEAEWEFAARGGEKSHNFKYSGSNDIDIAAWYWGNSEFTTHPVGEKAPNELGIYDMSGNVWEWCSDWYALYSNEIQTNPTGPAAGTCKVARGGSWGNNLREWHVSARLNENPETRNNCIGFRLVLP